MNEIEILSELLNTPFPKTENEAPIDTIAHVFKHEYKENFISDWLAYILSPDKIGTVEGLNSLLKLANFDSCFDEETSVEIKREHVFKDGRRIDFLIESEDILIGIENKIWSDLEKKQLKDYSSKLKELANGREIRKILLFPAKNKGTNITEAINNQKKLYDFVPVTYEELIDEFKNIHIDCISNLRASFLLQDFITHTEEYIVPNEQKIGTFSYETIEFANTNKKKIQDINKLVMDCKCQFKKYVEGRIAKEFNEGWEQHSPNSCNYFQIYKNNPLQWGKIHFELMSKEGFPPKKIQVVLHTKEGDKSARTDELIGFQDKVKKYLNDKYGSNEVIINYETQKTFDESFDKVIEMLSDIIKEYANRVDKELRKKLK